MPKKGLETSDVKGITRIITRFEVFTYETTKELEHILQREKCNILYCLKFGKNDGVVSKRIKTCIHCVFDLSEPHGNVYAAVSSALAKKFNRELFVPHMIGLQPSKTKENLRKELNIPDSAVVFGRYGGMDTFNISFCWEVIQELVNSRSDIYFLFINTPQQVIHPQVKYLPKVISEEEKNLFICTCDAHLECGTLGHSFGLAIGEFSVNNKPIIAYKGTNMWNTAHFDILGDNALYFSSKDEFSDILSSFNPKVYKEKDMNCYREYSPEKVMQQFKQIFID